MSHDGVVAIVTERLLLRPFERGDLPAFAAYRSVPAVAAFQSWDAPYSLADAERFLAEQERAGPGDWVQLAIVDRGDGTLLGDCAHRIADRQAEIGVTLAPAHQGRSVAREALTALLADLFERHDLHRVTAETDDRNAAAQRLLAGLGFREEGRLVEADWFKGEWTTLRLYGLLASEWRA